MLYIRMPKGRSWAQFETGNRAKAHLAMPVRVLLKVVARSQARLGKREGRVSEEPRARIFPITVSLITRSTRLTPPEPPRTAQVREVLRVKAKGAES